MKNIILIKQNKIHTKKIFKSFNKIPKHLFYLVLIELILLLTNFINILSSLFKNNALRNLQYNNNNVNPGYSDYTNSNSNNNNKKKTEAYEPIDPVIIIFFVFFVLFLILCLYLICEIKKIAPEKVSEFLKENVYKFLYMSNSGFFFTAICYSPMIHDLSVGYLTLVVSGIIFVIGSIILLKNLIRDSGGNCCTNFTSFDNLKNYFKIPCDYVWEFIGLTDPCCESNTYTVTTYSDGTTSSTKSCVECWNCFVLILKRVVLIIATILFYAFLIFLTVIFLILKFFYWLFTQSCNKANNQNENSNIPQNNEMNSNNGNIGSQQVLGNNGINPIEPKQEVTVQQENQLANNVIKNQVETPNLASKETLNLNYKANNNTTTLVIKDKSDNNLNAS
jgi:hypothetical protein